MLKILHDNDAEMTSLSGKTVAIIGFGSQGSAQALCLRDSGVEVIIGTTSNPAEHRARAEGFEVLSVAEATRRAGIVHILLPDEHHGPVFDQQIKPSLRAGQALCCSHGFSIVYKQVTPPENVDVFMVAPMGPGPELRRTYLEGFGLPGLIAVKQDYTGEARALARGRAGFGSRARELGPGSATTERFERHLGLPPSIG